LHFPDLAINVVHRSDGSGTTFLFTDYLSKISDIWKDQVGSNTSVDWPAGIGGKGNEGVANNVSTIKGSIGYVEYAYAKQNSMNVATLPSPQGFIKPDLESFQEAAKIADWEHTPGYGVILTDQPGKSWPITGATFILMHKAQSDPKIGSEVLKFMTWIYEKGNGLATELDYVPIPENVVTLIKNSWLQIR
jgi:phosphate transport system substrate-binding protein